MHPSLSSLTFGAEFEVLLPLSLPREIAARELSRVTGLTVQARVGASNSDWKVVSDGSLSGVGVHGLEFVSPILRGVNGLEQVQKIANGLRAIGATVNSTCGLHVHVGGHGGELSFFKNLIKLYGRFESVLDSLMPLSRRGNDATYCKSVALGSRDIDGCNSKEEIARRLALASRAYGAKYHKVNLVPVGKPTVEFRHHAGTVDAVKATNWVVTCLRMVAAAKEGKTGEGAMIAIDAANFVVKTRAVLEMCSRPEGATTREICERFGFSKISIKRHARLAGVAFRQTRDRYFVEAVAPRPGSVPVPVTLEGFTALIGSEEAAFLAARQQAFLNRV
jgi:hypothetical protein